MLNLVLAFQCLCEFGQGVRIIGHVLDGREVWRMGVCLCWRDIYLAMQG